MAGDKISVLAPYTTPIATDLFAIVDITTGITKKIDFSLVGSGSQTPWAQNIDAATFNLTDFGFLESSHAEVAQSGVIRLGVMGGSLNEDFIAFRNFGDTLDYQFGLAFSDDFYFVNPVATLGVGITLQSLALGTTGEIGRLSFDSRTVSDSDEVGFAIAVDVLNGVAASYASQVTMQVEIASAPAQFLDVNVAGNGLLRFGLDVDLQNNNILNVGFYESNATNPANAGAIRLGNTEVNAWRNAANSANLTWGVNASDQFVFGTTNERFGANIITNHPLVTAVATDFVLLYDNSDGLIKRADVNDFLSAASQTPWTSNIDADNNDLLDLANLRFDGAGSETTSSTLEIYSTSSGIILNVPTGDGLFIEVEGTLEYQFDGSQFSTQGNTLSTGGGILSLGAGQILFSPGGTGISIQSDDMHFDITASDIFSFDIAGTPVATIGLGELNNLNNNLRLGTGVLIFGNNEAILATSGDIVVNVSGTSEIRLDNNTTTKLTVDTNGVTFADRIDMNDSEIIDIGFLESGTTGDIANTGFIRMENVDQIVWRESINTYDLGLRITSSDHLEWFQPIAQTIFYISQSGTPANGDFMELRFNSGGADAGDDYAMIQGIVEDIAGTKEGSLKLIALENGVLTEYWKADGENVVNVFNRVLSIGVITSTATVGDLRMGNDETIGFRNAAGTDNLSIGFDGSDVFNVIMNGTTEMSISATTIDILGNDITNIQNLVHDVSLSGTDIDFGEDELQSFAVNANTTFTGVNYLTGKSKSVKLVTDGTLRTLAFPSGWVFIGSGAPADQAANKSAILSLTCFTGVESGVIASYAVEP